MGTRYESELVTADAIAKRFHVSVETVRRWTRADIIPCFRPSTRVVRYSIEAVDRALARAQEREDGHDE